MTKQFSELSVGERFTLNGVEYVKTQEVRVSCCRSINAQTIADSNNKTFIPHNTTVNVNA